MNKLLQFKKKNLIKPAGKLLGTTEEKIIFAVLLAIFISSPIAISLQGHNHSPTEQTQQQQESDFLNPSYVYNHLSGKQSSKLGIKQIWNIWDKGTPGRGLEVTEEELEQEVTVLNADKPFKVKLKNIKARQIFQWKGRFISFKSDPQFNPIGYPKDILLTIPAQGNSERVVTRIWADGRKENVRLADLNFNDEIIWNGQRTQWKSPGKMDEAFFASHPLPENEVWLVLQGGGYARIEEEKLEKGDEYWKNGNFYRVKDIKTTQKPEYEMDEVIDTWNREVDSILELTLANGEKIGVTDEHPFLTAQGKWVAAKNLAPGSLLQSHKEGLIAVKSIKEIKGKTRVYGITTKKNHNYMVGKAGLVVHNNCTVLKGEVVSGGKQYEINDIEGDGQVVDKSTGKELEPMQVFKLSANRDLQLQTVDPSLPDAQMSLLQTLTMNDLINIGEQLDYQYSHSSGFAHLQRLQDKNRLFNAYQHNLIYKYKPESLSTEQLTRLNKVLNDFKADTTEKGKIILGMVSSALALKGIKASNRIIEKPNLQGVRVGEGSILRNVDFAKGFKHAGEKHLFGDGPVSLRKLDPQGNPEIWKQYIVQLAQSGKGNIKQVPTGEIMEIQGKIPKTNANGSLDLGVRLFRPSGSQIWELTTILTRQK